MTTRIVILTKTCFNGHSPRVVVYIISVTNNSRHQLMCGSVSEKIIAL